MRIDGTHRPWIVTTSCLFVAATVFYVWYASHAPAGPRGGSLQGLIFGISGYALMLFAGLLSARKKKPVWRLGRTKTWMRGHLWLGLLSFPLILYHAGFASRGPLTRLLMILMYIVIGSGVVGALFQHYLPRLMTSQVPLETIYEQIPRVREKLQEEADRVIVTACGSLEGTSPDDIGAMRALIAIEYGEKVKLRQFYTEHVRPFLQQPDDAAAPLRHALRSQESFSGIRTILPETLHPALEDLEEICEEERQLILQKKLYVWLHGWLVVHVPLSIVLLLLGGVHAVMALRY